MISAETCVFILFTFFGNVIISSLTTSIYNINDLSSSLDNLKVGDNINYEINGYSDWKIISIDKENGTIEVTSNSNVYDLTIEPNKTVDEYNAIFQAEADKFSDIVMLYQGKNYFTNKNKVMYFVYNRGNSYVQCQSYYCFEPPTDSSYVSFKTTNSK